MILTQNTARPSTVIARSEATKQSRGFTHETGLPRRSDDLLAMTNDDSEDRLGGALKWANELGQSCILENKKNRQRQWTKQKRAQQAKILNDNKPWLKSTGPKTPDGKTVASQNAYKHGFRSEDYREICRLLKIQHNFVRQISRDTHEKIRELRINHAKNASMTTLEAKAREIKEFLGREGFSVPMREVKRMIKEVAGYGEEDFITRPETPLTPDQEAAIDAVVKRRAAGEPLYRILGCREFWGLEFKVTPDTLDPRPDTETLVEAALKFAKQHPKNTNTVIARRPSGQRGNPFNLSPHPSESWDPLAVKQQDPKSSLGCERPFRILDLGTGTGCIPIALLSELPHAIAYAVDYSHPAAMVARENADNLGVGDRFFVIQGDWMAALKPESFDLIVSNPPYIEESTIQNLAIEVKNHDPILALSGGMDGLDCYKKIISALKIHLNGQNKAFLEIGVGQLESLAGLVDDSNLLLCDSYADIAGIPRVVEISNGDK